MTTETEQLQAKQPSKLEILQGLVRTYCGKEPNGMEPKQLGDLIKATPEYQKFFAVEKDSNRAVQKMRMKTTPDKDAPAWLVDGNFERKYNGVVKGHGAKFLLPNGEMKFVEYGGPITDGGQVMDEYVFANSTQIHDVVSGVDSYSIPSGTKPTRKAHGQDPPGLDLTKEFNKCFVYNDHMNRVPGESYGQVLAVMKITDNEHDISFFPRNDDGRPAALRFRATDKSGRDFTVEADVEEACQKLGLIEDAPARIWQATLVGQPIVASGKMSVFLERSDGDFWGGKGTLAGIAAQLKPRMVPPNPKKPNNLSLSFEGLKDEKTGEQTECIPVGDKWLYRLEAYPGKDGDGHKGYVRADQELDRNQRPYPPSIDCVPKVIDKSQSGWTGTINEGAFVNYTNFAPGKPLPKDSPFQGILDF